MLYTLQNYKKLFEFLISSRFAGGPEGPGEQIDKSQEVLEGAEKDGETLREKPEELDKIIDNKANELTNNLDKIIKEQNEVIENRNEYNINSLKSIGKIDTDNSIARFPYIDSLGNKDQMTFDLKNQTIEFAGKSINIEMPKGASLSLVDFQKDKVVIEGKIGWFSGSGITDYNKLIFAIDDTLNKGQATIAAGDNEVKFKVA